MEVGGVDGEMAALPKDGSPEFSTTVSETHGVFSNVPAATATCRLLTHCGRGRRSLDAVARRKATRVASRAAAGSSRLRSGSVSVYTFKHVRQ